MFVDFADEEMRAQEVGNDKMTWGRGKDI